MTARVAAAAALLLCIAATSAGAQDASRTWLGLGLGGGASTDDGGLALLGEVVHQKAEHYFSLRGVLMADPSADKAFGDFGVLYGRAAKRKLGHAAIAAGLAVTGFDVCPSARNSGCATLGIPIVAEAAFRPVKVFGVGAQLFLNVNNKAVYGGLVLVVQVGWMP